MRRNLVFEIVPLSEVPRPCPSDSLLAVSPVVLVVDDEDIIADTRSAILSGWGYAVKTAYNAEECLQLARKDPPDFLISDVNLCRMNGVDLAVAVRILAPKCQVVLFSGEADSLALLATARNASHSFTLLQKPVHPSHLRAFLPPLNAAADPTATLNEDGSQLR